MGIIHVRGINYSNYSYSFPLSSHAQTNTDDTDETDNKMTTDCTDETDNETNTDDADETDFYETNTDCTDETDNNGNK